MEMKKTFLLLSLLITLPFVAIKAQTAGENIDVTHYEIHLSDFDFTSRTLMGYAYVTVTTTAPTDTFVLELKSLNVTYVSSDGYSVNHFSQEGDLLVIVLDIPAPTGSTMTLYISYQGSTFGEAWGGVEWWGSDYVYNLGVGFESQPHNLGKTWFPCVDNFTDKATYDLFITATNDKKAICGGNHIETIDNGDGTSTWHWETPQEIATYHISFAVGDFVLWQDVYHGIERDIPIEVYTTPSLSGRVEATFANIHEIVAFFEEHLGPYPFNRIGYISTSKGCMEHTDNIALATSVISGNTSYEEYLAHELSHMWSGNLVTCESAGDMWLNEGFAQFWGKFYRSGVYGEQAFQDMMSALVNSISGWCNNESNWIPLNNMPLDMTYDGDAVYDRGAVIVNTMMNYMGRESFLYGMRQYFDEYAYQAATSEQLCKALTQYTGIDMHGFFDTYVYSSGMPHLYATIKSVEQVDEWYDVTVEHRYQHIGDTHIGQHNAYELTFIGPDFQLDTERVVWNGLQYEATVSLGFEPVGMVGDFYNGWLDGKTQKNFMLKTTSTQSYANFRIEPMSIGDSVFVAVENHLVGPYDDPLIPNLTMSTKHFWTINRYDFGEANLVGAFDYTNTSENDIIHSENDSTTLLYRRDASEAWHEMAHTVYPGSTWRRGRLVVEDFPSGEYAIAVWDKQALGMEEYHGKGNSMQLYPNPAENRVSVTWGEKGDGQVRILSPEGKELRRIGYRQAQGVDIATDDLPKGCCTVLRLGSDGQVIETEKLIIK